LPTKRVNTKKPLQAKTHRNQEAVADQNASKPRSRGRQKRIETKKPLPTKTHQYTESAACKTHQQPAPVARDTQIYKKVLGSRRYLATVFWSLSTATSDTQRERAFVKTAYPSQHTQSTKRFANNMTQPNEAFCQQRDTSYKAFCQQRDTSYEAFYIQRSQPTKKFYLQRHTYHNISKRSSQSWKNGKDHFINPTSLSELTAPKSPPQKHTSPCQKKPPKKAWFF
jgi:hypothetical protein